VVARRFEDWPNAPQKAALPLCSDWPSRRARTSARGPTC
jgi:hypothetical protein